MFHHSRPYSPYPWSLRCIILFLAVTAVLQFHIIYQYHEFFLSYIKPVQIDSREGFETDILHYGNNEIIRLQCEDIFPAGMKSVTGEKTAIQNLINRKDSGYYYYCQAGDGLFLVQRQHSGIQSTSIKATIDFGNTDPTLEDAVFLASHKNLELHAEDIARNLVHFVFVEQSTEEVAFLFIMYLLLLWFIPLSFCIVQYRSLKSAGLKDPAANNKRQYVPLVAYIALFLMINAFVYRNLRDINSFKGTEWRDIHRYDELIERVMQLQAKQPSLNDLAEAHEEMLQNTLGKKVQGQVTLVRKPLDASASSSETQRSEKSTLEGLYGIRLILQNETPLFFPIKQEQFIDLQETSVLCSLACLKPFDFHHSFNSNPFSITGQRELHQIETGNYNSWLIQNKIKEITADITFVADCRKQLLYWIFRDHYIPIPMKKMLKQ